jgi:hypothetical protein
MLRRLAEKNLIAFADTPEPAPTDAPLAPRHAKTLSDSAEGTEHGYGPPDLAQYLPGHLRQGGRHPRDLTSEAFRKVTGRYLPGDPRA